MLQRRGGRPSRPEIERAALALLRAHGPEILATARRYAATLDDAEDAYQRGLEILLNKAPMTNQDELLPWLKTVVKHEAFALRRQRDRATPLTDDGDLRERPGPEAATHQQAERFERLRHGAEALGRLKPQEVRCLLLRAEGLTYREISVATGFSYTKVNRCLTEGRRAFVQRISGIEGGAECERLAPELSALADGEASAEQLTALRPHLRSCLECRSRLREYRTAPARVAALLPPLALAAGPGRGSIRPWLESLAGSAQHKAAAAGDRLHSAVELATGQKVAVVAASAAALAGGGTAVHQIDAAQPEQQPKRDVPAKRVAAPVAKVPVTPVVPPTVRPPAQRPPPNAQRPARQAPSTEFAPAASASPAAGPAPAPASGGGGGGGGEFAP